MTKKKVATKPAASSKKLVAVAKPYTKTEILSEMSSQTALSRKQVVAVMEALESLIARHLKKGSKGIFILPGLLKIQTVHKPATKARKGVNPFTGEPTVFKAKPAHNSIKIRALKKLKGMV